jgi:hypothetical protein
MRISMSTATTLAAALVGLLGVAGGAQAAPIQYNFTSGSVTLSVTAPVVGTILSGSIPLTGTQATFDQTTVQLTSFQFNNSGSATIPLSGLFPGTSITVSGFNVVPGGGYATISSSGSNPYNYLVGPVVVSGNYSLSGAIIQPTTAFSGTNPSLARQPRPAYRGADRYFKGRYHFYGSRAGARRLAVIWLGVGARRYSVHEATQSRLSDTRTRNTIS